MAYDVAFTIPQRVLGKADVEFRVKRNGGALGTLKVSNGTAVWAPVNKQYGFKMGWKDFGELMQKHEKPE